VNTVPTTVQRKTGLLLKNIFQNTQTLQLFKINMKQKVFKKLSNMPKLQGLREEG
jgi:hypothetical protein